MDSSKVEGRNGEIGVEINTFTSPEAEYKLAIQSLTLHVQRWERRTGMGSLSCWDR